MWVLKRSASEFWNNTYQTIGIIAQVLVILVYTFDWMLASLALYYPELETKKTYEYDFFYNLVVSNL